MPENNKRAQTDLKNPQQSISERIPAIVATTSTSSSNQDLVFGEA